MDDRQLSHPRDRIAQYASRVGEPAVVAACCVMLEGGEASPAATDALGGERAVFFLSAEQHTYWGRVWGARGLLYVWGDEAIPVLRRATRDEHWRVREMVAKVVARRRVDVLAGAVAPLRADPVARVRAAAERALVSIARDALGAQRETKSQA